MHRSQDGLCLAFRSVRAVASGVATDGNAKPRGPRRPSSANSEA